MPATDLEIALEKVDAGTFEKLAAEILSERGYDVSPTEGTGADGGRDTDSGGVKRRVLPTSPPGTTGNRNSERTHRKRLNVIWTVTSWYLW